MENRDDNLVSGNALRANGESGLWTDSSNLTVRDNIIEGNGLDGGWPGYYARFGSTVEVADNLVRGNGRGMRLGGLDFTVHGNVVAANEGYGIRIISIGHQLANNTVVGNAGDGLHFFGRDLNGTATGSTVTGNDRRVVIEATHVTLDGARICGSADVDVYITELGEANVIRNSRFDTWVDHSAGATTFEDNLRSEPFVTDRVEWLPPVTRDEFTLLDGTTLPLRFELVDTHGAVVLDVQDVYLTVTDETGAMMEIWELGGDHDSLRFHEATGVYGANLHTRATT